jgi:hypothetical protein
MKTIMALIKKLSPALDLQIYTDKVGGSRRRVIRKAYEEARGRDHNQEAALRIGKLIVVSLGRLLGEVLYELPVIPVGIVEVDTFPVGVRVRDSRFPVSCCFEPRAQ